MTPVPAVATPEQLHATPSSHTTEVVRGTAVGGPNGGAVGMRTRNRNGTGLIDQHAVLLDARAEQAGGQSDTYLIAISGTRAEAPQEQGVAWSVAMPPSLDSLVMRFVLSSNNWPAQEGARKTQSSADAMQESARVTLVEDAPTDAPTTGCTTSFARVRVVEPGGSGLSVCVARWCA